MTGVLYLGASHMIRSDMASEEKSYSTRGEAIETQ
jgi:hypothetical protein